MRSLSGLWFAAVVAGCAGAPPAPSPSGTAPPPVATAPAAATSVPGGELFRLPTDVHPQRQKVSLEVVPEKETFQGRVEIALLLDAPRSDLYLSARGLRFGKGSLRTASGELPVTAEPDDVRGAARLVLPSVVPAGKATLVLDYEGRLDARLVGLYRVKTSGGWAAYSQFEAIDARRAFPCFDEPGFKIPWDIEVRVPEALAAFSNTPVTDELPATGGMKLFRFQTTRPLPSYLLAFAVGDFDVVTPPPLPPNEVRSTPLQLRGIAPKGRGAELAYAMKAAGELLVGLERWFGIPYPYPKLDHVAVPDFAYGAMENAGIITYVDNALLVSPNASQKQKTQVAAVIAHEMAHQWFGDLVTMRFWEDLWLNESFATFMTSEVVPAWDPRLGYDLTTLASGQGAMDNDALARAHPLRHPLRTEADIFGFDAKVLYPKGAATLRMFRGYLGRERFRKAIADYLLAHADGNATSEDLIAALERAEAGTGDAFRSFLVPPGLPRVDARLSCERGHARLMLSQQRSLPLGSTASTTQLWSIPVCARVEGRSAPACTLLTGATGSLDLGARCPRWVHPNASADGYYRWTLPAKDLDRLEGHLKSLSALERLSLADAILAGAEQGRQPAAEALKRARPLLRDEEPAVVKRTLEALVHARWYWTTSANRTRFEARARELLQPVLARWGWEAKPGELARVTEFRPTLLEDLALEFDDPAVLKRASALGHAWLGVGVPRDPAAVSGDLRPVALRAAARTGDVQVYEAISQALDQSQDRPTRRDLVEALGSFIDPTLAARARARVLEPGLTAHERTSLLEAQSETLEQSQATWAWVVENQGALATLLPENQVSNLPQLHKGATVADARALRSAFTEATRRAGSGLSYQIDKSGEEIEIRAAVREVQAPSLASALGAGHRPASSGGR